MGGRSPRSNGVAHTLFATSVFQIDRELGAMAHGDVGFANYQVMFSNGEATNKQDNTIREIVK